MTTKWCPRCKATRPIGDFYKNKARRDGLSSYCTTCQIAADRASFLDLRARVIAHLGGRCVRCEYDTDVRAFQIDHVNGGGHLERQGGMWARKLMNAVLADTEGKYQLLCANCNQIKRLEEREIGARVYVRDIPTERIDPGPNRRWTPEARAKQAEQSRRMWAEHPEVVAAVRAGASKSMQARWDSGEMQDLLWPGSSPRRKRPAT